MVSVVCCILRSTSTFQRVAAAHDTLGDAVRRGAYDDGADVPRGVQVGPRSARACRVRRLRPVLCAV
jgi:curved DNA-binding protein CbpA